MVRKLIVFGGGRMGLSHAAMAGLLDPAIKITLVEPNFKARAFLKLIVGRGVRVVDCVSAEDVKTTTHAIIATPPKVHQTNFDELTTKNFKGFILIEKPIMIVGAELNRTKSVMSGYVLRHAYFWECLKTSLLDESVLKAKVCLTTNQDFGSMLGSWRSGDSLPGLGLLSEFGSHCVNLLLDLMPISQLSIESMESNCVSLVCSKNSEFRVELVANSSNVRKSVYRVEVETEKQRIVTDFYSFSQTRFQKNDVSYTNLAESGVRASAYLRGQEFSMQMENFLNQEKFDEKNIKDALETDRILNEVVKDLQCQK